MESKDKRNFFRSIGYALQGLKFIFGSEAYFKYESIVGIIIIILSFLFKINRTEWIVVILLISFMLMLEILNTSFEKICDEITTKYNINIKHIKDISALAVFIMAIASTIIGLLIFLPKIINLIK